MNKQVKVLYTIFELELSPPFKIIREDDYPHADNIINKHSECIGTYHRPDKKFGLTFRKGSSILRKVKQVFNHNKISDDDAYHIVKHLFNWLQNKFTEEIETVSILNDDTLVYAIYQIEEKQ